MTPGGKTKVGWRGGLLTGWELALGEGILKRLAHGLELGTQLRVFADKMLCLVVKGTRWSEGGGGGTRVSTRGWNRGE